MTENEKAATFIGWFPGEKCSRKNWAEHDVPTPDMTNSRNRWLLLEALLQREICIDFAGDRLGGDDNYVRLDATCLNKKWDFGKMELKDRQYGPALVELAATLYDAEVESRAEHPQS